MSKLLQSIGDIALGLGWRAVEALIREELRRIRSEKEAITGRYGVSSLEELMAKVEEGIVSDVDAHDDIVKLDYLEYVEEQLLSKLRSGR